MSDIIQFRMAPKVVLELLGRDYGGQPVYSTRFVDEDGYSLTDYLGSSYVDALRSVSAWVEDGCRLAGIPDLVVVAAPGRAHFIEVKTPSGRVSPEQREIMRRLELIGAKCVIAKSIDDVRAAFAEWAIPTREAAQ